MHKPSSEIHLLACADPEAALAQGYGKLVPVALREERMESYGVLDTFDGSVGDGGRVLIQAGDQLWLISGLGQVLKQTGTVVGGFVQDIPPGPIRDGLSGVPKLRSLQIIGAGEARIQHRALVDAEGKTQVRYESLILQPESGDPALVMVAVQGLRGYGAAFDRMSEALKSVSQFDGVSVASLSARLCPAFQPHTPKPAVPLSPTATAFSAACALIAAHIPIARATEAGVIADLDTEYLHDYRVALRKIRSVLSLFKGVYSEARTAELKATFSELMAPTGRLRDLDVYLLEKDHYFGMLPQTLHPGLTEMFRRFEAERGSEHAMMARRLKSKSYLRKIESLEALFADPESVQAGPEADLQGFDYARRLIWKRYRKVCKIAGAIDAQTDDEEVHELRIHCKKLRYLMEFFAPFFPKDDIKGLIKALKRLQDNLGLFNDYSVQQDSLKAFLDTQTGLTRAKAKDVAQTIGALIVILHQRQAEERAKVMASFAGFDSDGVRAKFRQLFRDEGHA